MELLYFYLPGCPYCRKADEALAELFAENPAYRGVKLRRVDETAERALAEAHDYWRVPTFFLDGRKLYEARPGDDAQTIKREVRAALDAASRQSA